MEIPYDLKSISDPEPEPTGFLNSLPLATLVSITKQTTNLLMAQNWTQN